MNNNSEVLNEYNRRIGNQIKKIRKANGETQQDLGNLLGFSAKHIGALENGQRRTTGDVLYQIQEHYQISAEQLFEDLPGSYTRRKENEHFSGKIEELSEEHQKMVNAVIKAFWLEDNPDKKFED